VIGRDRKTTVVNFRLTPELKLKLEKSARLNCRTLSGEIEYTLRAANVLEGSSKERMCLIVELAELIERHEPADKKLHRERA
jgi:hypothetical protein